RAARDRERLSMEGEKRLAEFRTAAARRREEDAARQLAEADAVRAKHAEEYGALLRQWEAATAGFLAAERARAAEVQGLQAALKEVAQSRAWAVALRLRRLKTLLTSPLRFLAGRRVST